MIAHLRGAVLEKSPGRVVLETGGVGYEALVSIATFSQLPEIGGAASLHVYTHVREDALSLFGFSTPAEKRLFEKLISVSGVGPKLALTILSGLETDRLIMAIRSSDHAMLTRIPGVGKKTAERVALELKDKLDAVGAASASAPGSTQAGGPVAEDVRSALENLGYPRHAAEKALQQVLSANNGTTWDFEALFRAAVAAVR